MITGRKAACAIAASALLLCVVLVASNNGQTALEGDLPSIASNSGLDTGICESSSEVVAAIHTAFKKMQQKLLDIYGQMDMAVKNDKCGDVVSLVKAMQDEQSEFSSLQTEYVNLAPKDQEGVQLCFEATLQPISAKLQTFSVSALSQCSPSNPSVLSANALIDGLVGNINSLEKQIETATCKDLDSLMDQFSSEAATFRKSFADAMSTLATGGQKVEETLLTQHAEQSTVSATESFYAKWEAAWDASCEKAEVVAEANIEDEAAKELAAEEKEKEREAQQAIKDAERDKAEEAKEAAQRAADAEKGAKILNDEHGKAAAAPTGAPSADRAAGGAATTAAPTAAGKVTTAPTVAPGAGGKAAGSSAAPASTTVAPKK